MKFAREGDAVVVHSIDRLARNLDDLRRVVQELNGRGVRIEFVKEQLTFSGEDSPIATLLLSVMGAFAELGFGEQWGHGNGAGICRSAWVYSRT